MARRSTILVTGAGGLVGSALVRAGARGLDHAALDVTDPAAVVRVLDEEEPRALVNAAAFARVDANDAQPERAWAVNAVAPGVLARACRAREVRLVHLSSDYVLDEPAKDRLDERVPARPRSLYAWTKRAGERAALLAGAVVVRVQWVYQPGHPGFFTRALERMAAGETVPLVTDQVGSPTPAEWLAPSLLRCAEGRATGLFHLACGGSTTPWEWIARAAAAVGVPFRARPITRAELGGAYRPARSCLDSRRFARTWGVEIPDWGEALDRALSRGGIRPFQR